MPVLCKCYLIIVYNYLVNFYYNISVLTYLLYKITFYQLNQNIVFSQLIPLRVYINMFRGRDLLAFDETGFSDPYVLLRLGSIQHQTDVVYRSLAPTWNQNFMFSLASINQDIHMTIVDKDFSFDDLMANCRIQLGTIPLQVRYLNFILLSDWSLDVLDNL